MKLNHHSYVHVNIRKACALLVQSTGMKLFTNLDEEFKEVKFFNALGYIVINWKKEVVFCLGHKLSKSEMELVKDISRQLNWLEMGIKLENDKRKIELRRLKRKKGVKNGKK